VSLEARRLRQGGAAWSRRCRWPLGSVPSCSRWRERQALTRSRQTDSCTPDAKPCEASAETVRVSQSPGTTLAVLGETVGTWSSHSCPAKPPRSAALPRGKSIRSSVRLAGTGHGLSTTSASPGSYGFSPQFSQSQPVPVMQSLWRDEDRSATWGREERRTRMEKSNGQQKRAALLLVSLLTGGRRACSYRSISTALVPKTLWGAHSLENWIFLPFSPSRYLFSWALRHPSSSGRCGMHLIVVGGDGGHHYTALLRKHGSALQKMPK
jgi:hypothetical protein